MTSIVADASPLIILFKSELEFILPILFDRILVPGAVFDEILAGSEGDRAKRLLPEISWITKVQALPLESELQFVLGRGECEVLSTAKELEGTRVLLDDAAARKAAKVFGIPFVGTGGVLVIAYRKGLIPSFDAALDAVTSSGLWISPEIERLLRIEANRKPN
ncbi:MAG TPA: DUF3368 domain-containing protein [Pyrinomonadaceae bacterium]|nr:DUF3368 domain-containing protein [Pyrinomonadaceae bacterium]